MAPTRRGLLPAGPSLPEALTGLSQSLFGASEPGHCDFAISADTVPDEDFFDSQKDDFYVQPERLVVDIPDIQLEFVFP